LKGGSLLIWEHISLPWQCAVEEAWAAYCSGSLPHGAVITNADGYVISRGCNRINEKAAEGTALYGHRLAHAEMNAMIQTDWSTVDARACILYTTIEPCAMCIGAIRMAHLQEIRYAARDNAAGGSSLIDKTPFLKSGGINIIGSEVVELEVVLLGMLIEVAWTIPHPNRVAWIEQLSSNIPVVAQLGYELFASKQLRVWKEEAKNASFVVDQLGLRYAKMLLEHNI
jgi:tRNA(Arg) A34 adenosine deaminase TadA